jgi:hypothetical protein
MELNWNNCIMLILIKPCYIIKGYFGFGKKSSGEGGWGVAQSPQLKGYIN